MKKMILFFMLPCSVLFSQGILEYDNEILANFYIHDSSESIYYKIEESEVNRKTPEGLAQSYFFAQNDNWVVKNYLKNTEAKLKKSSHYETIKKMKKNTNFIRIQHKITFNIENIQICYIMFTSELEGVDFNFPSIISCVKNNNEWLIYKLPNQAGILDVIWTFKSCKLAQLIIGNKVSNELTNSLIKMTRNEQNNLNINKLYNISNEWIQNGIEQQNFIMTENNFCNESIEKNINKNIEISANYNKVNFKIIKKEEQILYTDIIDKIKNKSNTDSIILISKLDVLYYDNNYSIIKYLKNNKTFNEVLNKTEIKYPLPIEFFLFLFKELKSDFLYDLTYPNGIEKYKTDKNFNIIFEKTRGQAGSLNTSKLYKLLKNNRELFVNYLEN